MIRHVTLIQIYPNISLHLSCRSTAYMAACRDGVHSFCMRVQNAVLMCMQVCSIHTRHGEDAYTVFWMCVCAAATQAHNPTCTQTCHAWGLVRVLTVLRLTMSPTLVSAPITFFSKSTMLTKTVLIFYTTMSYKLMDIHQAEKNRPCRIEHFSRS